MWAYEWQRQLPTRQNPSFPPALLAFCSQPMASRKQGLIIRCEGISKIFVSLHEAFTPQPWLASPPGLRWVQPGPDWSCTKNGASSGPPTPICRHHDAAKSLSSHSHAPAGANPSPTSTRLLVHLPIRIDWHLLHVASMHGAHRSGGNPGGRSTSALGHGAWTIWTADRQRRTAPLLSAWPSRRQTRLGNQQTLLMKAPCAPCEWQPHHFAWYGTLTTPHKNPGLPLWDPWAKSIRHFLS